MLPLVNSYLRYGIIVWGNANAEILKPLKSLNERVLRIITFAPLGKLDTSIIFKHLKILNFDKTFLLETYKFIYKSKNFLLPIESIATHFNRAASISHTYNTRSHSRNHLSTAPVVLLSSFAQKSIQHRSPELWRNIPTNIRVAESLNIFKAALKNHLLSIE